MGLALRCPKSPDEQVYRVRWAFKQGHVMNGLKPLKIKPPSPQGPHVAPARMGMDRCPRVPTEPGPAALPPGGSSCDTRVCVCPPKRTCESVRSTHVHAGNKPNILREGKSHVTELENEGECGGPRGREERDRERVLGGAKPQPSDGHSLPRMTVWA